jgi:hypothetical protein
LPAVNRPLVLLMMSKRVGALRSRGIGWSFQDGPQDRVTFNIALMRLFYTLVQLPT